MSTLDVWGIVLNAYIALQVLAATPLMAYAPSPAAEAVYNAVPLLVCELLIVRNCTTLGGYSHCIILGTSEAFVVSRWGLV